MQATKCHHMYTSRHVLKSDSKPKVRFRGLEDAERMAGPCHVPHKKPQASDSSHKDTVRNAEYANLRTRSQCSLSKNILIACSTPRRPCLTNIESILVQQHASSKTPSRGCMYSAIFALTANKYLPNAGTGQADTGEVVPSADKVSYSR